VQKPHQEKLELSCVSNYYLGDPCYVIPDAEWDDFCGYIDTDGDFEYKGETCRIVSTGGDGDFGGLSVDAGILGVIPISLCDPQKLISAAGHSRLVSKFVELEASDDFIWIDGVAINGVECECRACQYSHTNAHHDWNMTSCASCGSVLADECVEYIDGKEYCGEWCAEDDN
jgi:hypothetical protein